MNRIWEPNDVVQLKSDDSIREEFRGKLMIIEDPKPWGAQGYVDTFEGRAYFRANTEQMEYVGKLPIPPEN